MRSRDVGSAGLKDRNAITRQWLSFPRVDERTLAALEEPNLKVLKVVRHGNKLRTGHLRGNRFTVVLRGVCDEAEARARAIAKKLAARGLPNYYGPQRFGRQGDNATRGRAALLDHEPLPRDRRLRRLLISALQAQLFNEFLQRRLRDGLLARLLDGDVLQRRSSGGLFVSEDATTDQGRLESGELTLTGPICGPRTTRARPGSEAARFEQALLDELGLPDPNIFSRFGRLARGGRRALTVVVEGLEIERIDTDALRLRFSLPSGSYATTLLREICKQPPPASQR